MSSEANGRRKRAQSEGDSSKPQSDTDHRKRRRNRTTQSCLNCHTSKRMCDRKRPACARCTQLGLTGLCVYEVDDPNQRTEVQDESSRLLKRVAELEGVIRELKNKPNPRWVQPPGRPDGQPLSSADGPQAPSPSTLTILSDVSTPMLPSSSQVAIDHPYVSMSPMFNHAVIQSPNSATSSHGSPSPVMTPADEWPQAPVFVNRPESGPVDLDWTALLLQASKDGHGPSRRKEGDCGCLQESCNYNVMLKLSLRLRKAVEVLAHSPRHPYGSQCNFYQKVAEMDRFVTRLLGDINALPDVTGLMSHGSRTLDSATSIFLSNVLDSLAPPSGSSMMSSQSTPQLARPWDVHSAGSLGPPNVDDSFMVWEPTYRSSGGPN